MAQDVLSFTVDKKKYVSNPFSMEAACRIDDVRYHDEKAGIMRMCTDAVDYMFEGTEATQDVIDKLPVTTRMRLCRELWGMFLEGWTAKNE